MLLMDTPARQIGIEFNNQPYVSVDLGNFPNVNLLATPGYPYVCIEPMIGRHDIAESPIAIEDKPNLIALPTGQSKTYRFSVIIHER